MLVPLTKTPFCTAASSGDVHGLLLLDKEQQRCHRCRDQQGGWTAHACLNGHDRVVALLLLNGAETEVREPTYGYSSLMMIASSSGNTTVVNRLLAHGALIDAVDNEHSTALSLAGYFNHSETFLCLHARGAALFVANDDGDTPLCHAMIPKTSSCVSTVLACMCHDCVDNAPVSETI